MGWVKSDRFFKINIKNNKFYAVDKSKFIPAANTKYAEIVL